MNTSSQYVLLVVYASLLLILIIFAIALHLLLGKQKTRNYQMRLQEADQRFEHELMQIKLELQEKAFNQMSKEIHDNLGQVLSSVAVTLQCISPAKTTAEQAQDIIEQSVTRINDVTSELRNLSHMLNGALVERLGLVSAVKKEIGYLRLNNRMQVNFTSPPEKDMPVLNGSQTLLLFRIIQEAIQNVMRHAKASLLNIILEYDQFRKELSMQITDNGVGFAGNPMGPSGFGMLSMQERAALLNAQLKISGDAMKGSIIALKFKI